MLMKTIFFLLSLALLSCQGGRKQDIQSAEGTKHQIVDTASVYYVNPLLFIDLNNYVKKQVSDVHLGKGAVDLVFIIDKEGYIRDVTIKKSARENGAAPNVAARMDSIACKVIAELPRFTPATRDGKAVNFLKSWTVRFK